MNVQQQSTRALKKRANSLQKKGRYLQAKELLIQVSNTGPTDPQALYTLAQLHFVLREFPQCEACCRRTLSINTHDLPTWLLLGDCLAARQRLQEAARCFQFVVQSDPAHALGFYSLGNVYASMHNLDMAIGCFQQALKLRTDYVEVLDSLASCYRLSGNLEMAAKCLDAACGLRPDSPSLLYNAGLLYIAATQPEHAIASLRRAIELKPDFDQAHLALGQAYALDYRLDQAINCYAEAARLNPGDPGAIAAQASVLERRGDIAGAYGLIRPWLNGDKTPTPIAKFYCVIASSLEQQKQAIQVMESVIARPDIDLKSKTDAHYELGRLYDEQSRHASAFSHFEQANATQRNIKRDTSKKAALDYALYHLEEMKAQCDKEFWRRCSDAGVSSDRPVFVVGMPRSGTTLVEQILSAHPQVYGAGELKTIQEQAHVIAEKYAANAPYPLCLNHLSQPEVQMHAETYLERLGRYALDRQRVVDKMPYNFLHLGLVASLFPKARVIHVMRDPLDTCVSIYFQRFNPVHTHTTDLRELGSYYRAYARLMHYWREVLPIPILDLHYEDLVAGQERLTRQLLEFCGLEWDARCLTFHEHKRDIDTPSYYQVRQPMYARSIGRWKHYSTYLDPLREALSG